jgi:hypothetical protein
VNRSTVLAVVALLRSPGLDDAASPRPAQAVDLQPLVVRDAHPYERQLILSADVAAARI